ncbi:esterase/lipase [Exophiala viscosa]|uniref:Esterase/lipase n=1 Tax=Exophiala viscosa TaxID=2486360 RepID=A0AAN6E305_9EURO|nr:esterase/lipase [Exophiala viscosa]
MRATESTSHPYVLNTSRGSLKGVEHRTPFGQSVVYRFANVPYALPPVGSRRWRRPVPLPTDFTFNNASGQPGDYTAFGPICPQPHYNHGLAMIENPEAAPPIDNTQDEDCLYLNIWVPAAPAPEGGWPVQFQIHGGWLQVGNAMQDHQHDPFDLIKDTTPRVIVSPTYRLNLFGFLAGEELASLHEESAPSNFGLWDQRCALEWTAKHISLFQGNPDNITVGGLSAGANSTFFQLNYDTLLPASQQLVKRVYLWSNAVAIQPNKTTAPILTSQFNELCTVLDIPSSLTPAEKLSRLRAIPYKDLVVANTKMKMHTFRSSTDNDFILPTFLSSLHSGSFTTRLAQSGISVLLGEVSDEKELYKLVNPPSDYSGLLLQLANYYPKPVLEALLKVYDLPPQDSTDTKAWAEVFSQMVADNQVHCSLRGLAHILLNPPSHPGVTALPQNRVHRYRIAWRAKALDNWVKPEVGVCHGGDMPVWWASAWRADFLEADKDAAKKFLEPFGQFLHGEEVQWGCTGEDRVRLLDKDGVVKENTKDGLWERGMQVFNAVWEAQKNTVDKDTSLDSRL